MKPGTSSAGRTSPSSLMRGGRSTAVCPMSRYGTWSPTWPLRSSAHPIRAIQVLEKIHEYFEAGVSRVWVVYPARRKSTSTRRRPRFRFCNSARSSTAAIWSPVSVFRWRRCSRTIRSDRVRVSMIDLSSPRPCPRRPRSRRPPLNRLTERLKRETRAEVYFDQGMRGLYATDASLYQIEPLGVVVPRTLGDVAAVVKIAADEHLPILPRGAATSLSGQTVGPAIVIDFSKYLNRIGIVDRDAMTVRVEPGVVLDQLNAHLKPLGLMFGPDVSTSDRATIGGMIGNNSAGARSLRYGKTVDHVRPIEVVLADGTRPTSAPFPPESSTRSAPGLITFGAIHRVVRDTVADHRRGDPRPVSAHPAQGQRLQPR